MSDGMTDKRSQPEYATEYLRRDTFEKIVEQTISGLMTSILDDPDFMAEHPMTVVELRALGHRAGEVVAKAMASNVRVR